jgi:hypothetical protein
VTRRVVRVDSQFFADLDAQLGDTRGPNGEPSSSDFLLLETADGEYNYGEFGWLTVPPGPTCTFTQEEHGFDQVRGPNLGMSIWLALVGAGTATAGVIAIRDTRTRSGELQAQR